MRIAMHHHNDAQRFILLRSDITGSRSHDVWKVLAARMAAVRSAKSPGALRLESMIVPLRQMGQVVRADEVGGPVDVV